MTMSNGTQDQKLQFKPRKIAKVQQPDAPEGEWGARIPKGKCKMLITRAGDPRLIIPFKLEKAEDEANEKYQGAEVQLSIIVFDVEDATKRKGSNMMVGRLRALCETVDVEFDEVYPDEVTDKSDFDKLFTALEGKTLTIWTVHTTRKVESGETITDTEIRFKKPGAGLVTKGADKDEDEAPARGKKTAGRRR